jgi:RNA recognition motif-containing protein
MSQNGDAEGGLGGSANGGDQRAKKQFTDDGVSMLVRNLPERATAGVLRDKFTADGANILDVYIPLDYYTKRQKSFAFVQFANSDDARAAFDKAGSDAGLYYEDRKLELEYAKDKRKAKDEMRKVDPRRGGGGRDAGRGGRDDFRREL